MAAGPNSMVALIIPMSSSSAGPKPQPPGQPPRPDQGLPGQLPRPEHPIYYPLPPGAPVDPAYGIPEGARPDQGLPGSQPKPDQGLPKPPGQPSHPIVLPPGNGDWEPVYIWGQRILAQIRAFRASSQSPIRVCRRLRRRISICQAMPSGWSVGRLRPAG